jgi:hypothetical protein
MTTTYRIHPLAFTPSPGPVRLYGERPASRIASVIVDYVDADGREVEVARLEDEDEHALIMAARAASGRHFLDVVKSGGFAVTSCPPSILAKHEAEALKRDPRPFAGDNS